MSTDIERALGSTSASDPAPAPEKPRVYHVLSVRREGTDVSDEERQDIGLRIDLDLGEVLGMRWEIADDNFDDIEYQFPGYDFSARALAEWSEIVAQRVRQAMASAPAVDPNRYFGHDGKFIKSALEADLQFDGTVFSVGHDKRLWRYRGGAYVPDGEEQLRARVRHFMGDRFSKHYANEMLAYIEAETVHKPLPDTPDRGLINFTNTMLDWTRGEMTPHDPKLKSTLQLPVAWRPEMPCPQIDEFIRGVFPEDAQEFAYELVGYFMMPSNPLKKSFLLRGPTNTGKSTFLALLKMFLGSRNCAAVPLQYLENERWGGAALYGKLANLVGEMNDKSIETSALFKQIVGGTDTIFAEHKNKPTFEFMPFCKFLFSANRPPMTRDQSNAYFERWVIIPFETAYDIQPTGRAQMADTNLSSKLWHPAELSGLANRAVAGLRRLMARGHFDIPASVKAETDRYKLTADSVRSFLSETCEKGDIDKDSQLLSDMYSNYKFWCRDSGRHELSRVNFLAQIEELFQPREYRITGSGGTRMVWGWKRSGASEPQM
jgi:P4 family phage/plasmid primase-like protien